MYQGRQMNDARYRGQKANHQRSHDKNEQKEEEKTITAYARKRARYNTWDENMSP